MEDIFFGNKQKYQKKKEKQLIFFWFGIKWRKMMLMERGSGSGGDMDDVGRGWCCDQQWWLYWWWCLYFWCDLYVWMFVCNSVLIFLLLFQSFFFLCWYLCCCCCILVVPFFSGFIIFLLIRDEKCVYMWCLSRIWEMLKKSMRWDERWWRKATKGFFFCFFFLVRLGILLLRIIMRKSVWSGLEMGDRRCDGGVDGSKYVNGLRCFFME